MDWLLVEMQGAARQEIRRPRDALDPFIPARIPGTPCTERADPGTSPMSLLVLIVANPLAGK